MILKTIVQRYVDYLSAQMYSYCSDVSGHKRVKDISESIVNLVIGYVLTDVRTNLTTTPSDVVSYFYNSDSSLTEAYFEFLIGSVVITLEFIESDVDNEYWRFCKCAIGDKDIAHILTRMVKEICMSNAYPDTAPPLLLHCA